MRADNTKSYSKKQRLLSASESGLRRRTEHDEDGAGRSRRYPQGPLCPNPNRFVFVVQRDHQNHVIDNKVSMLSDNTS